MVILAALWFGIDRLDHDVIISSLAEINILYLLLASLTIFGVMALSTTRFSFINGKFGGTESWLFLHRVNMLSLLYGQIALPLIAQIIGRVSHGTSEQRIYYAPLTVLEKSMAFAIMILFGGFASYALLNQNIIPQGLPLALAVMGGSVLGILTASVFLFFSSLERREFLTTISKITHLGILRILGLSVLIQLGILLSYTILALQFVPEAPLMTLVGGFAIVVLATSVPIGFGGWGVREAAAAAIFIALGFPAEIGVIIGILYGLINLIILVITVAILHQQKQTLSPSKVKSAASNPFAGINFWPITALLMMALLPFQIRLPMTEGLITLSSVDLIALVVMINFIVREWLAGHLKTLWAESLTWIGIFCLGVMIVIGWVVGWINFGSNEWATANRLTGLILVFSFLFAGAALRRYIEPSLMARLVLVLLFSLIASVVIKIIAFNIFDYKPALFFNWGNYVNGFIADRNAFSFMSGLAVILAAFHLDHYKQNKFHELLITLMIPILMVFLLYTGSRSGFGASVFIMLWLIISFPRHFQVMILSAVGTVFFVELIDLIEPTTVMNLFDGRSITKTFTVSTLRADTYQAGVDLFFANPIFGAGLGAGIRETGLVIHNLYLWILGEMGLLGAALCLPLALAFAKTSKTMITAKNEPFRHNGKTHAIILFIIICGGFSLVQDVAYQRILWLLVGFILATPYADKEKNNS